MEGKKLKIKEKGNKERRRQILECAARFFRKKGYNATTVRMIAAELHIEAASLYNHIASKQELLQEILLPIARLFARGMDKIEQSGENAFEKLEALVALHIHLTQKHPDAISLITGEWIHLEEPALSQYAQLRSDYEKRFKTLILSGMEDGLLENQNVDVALFSILSSLHWLYSWMGRHKEIAPEKLESELKNCLLRGLQKRNQIIG